MNFYSDDHHLSPTNWMNLSYFSMVDKDEIILMIRWGSYVLRLDVYIWLIILVTFVLGQVLVKFVLRQVVPLFFLLYNQCYKLQKLPRSMLGCLCISRSVQDGTIHIEDFLKQIFLKHNFWLDFLISKFLKLYIGQNLII